MIKVCYAPWRSDPGSAVLFSWTHDRGRGLARGLDRIVPSVGWLTLVPSMKG
jgi:hypothetical protein